HPDPVLWRRGHVRPLAPIGRQPPLGLGAGAGQPGLLTVPLEPGDRLLFYTDGIAEARERRTGDFFPLLPATERALDARHPLDEGLASLAREVRAWTGSALGDDVALLAAEVPGGPGPASGTQRPRRP